ncbi:MAG: glycosyltransferase family 4 protein [Nitrososphaeraceae archaeon]
MVSTEYPPMKGGIGRYTKNLVVALRNIGTHDVYVVCNEKGAGDFFGLDPTNEHNSDILLELVDKLHLDVVHVQYEHGLYGLKLGAINPKNTSNNIDSFYDKCKVPIVTTFHSAYTFREWMNLVVPVRKKETDSKLRTCIDMLFGYWKHLINFKSFSNLNRQKLEKSAAGIVFSNYLSRLISGDGISDGCNVIYHGSASALSTTVTKKEALERLRLPGITKANSDSNITSNHYNYKKVALALGFLTATKGWDIFKNMDIPSDWVIVLNHSKNYYNKEIIDEKSLGYNEKIINLQRDFLSDEDLSLLMYAADAIIIPYKVCSSSGVMFDALAHRLPFVGSNLPFFKEFAAHNLGISVRNWDPKEFSNALETLSRNYSTYKQAVDNFKGKLDWEFVAREHANIYMKVVKGERRLNLIASRHHSNIFSNAVIS